MQMAVSSAVCNQAAIPSSSNPSFFPPTVRIYSRRSASTASASFNRQFTGLVSTRQCTNRAILTFSPLRKRECRLLVQAAKQTFSSFDEMIESSDQPVLVDFYATWCGPCQFMVPILEDVGRRLKDKIRVVKIDTEKYPAIASRYNVQALPTFILFKDGQPCDRLEGALPADQLTQRIEEVIRAAS